MNASLLAEAIAAYQAGNFDDAASRSRAALEQAPQDETLLTLLALAEHSAGNFDAAADAFKTLVVQHPLVAEYWSNLGYMLRLMGRYSEAEEAFVEALSLAPRAHDALLNYGLLLLDMGRFGAARHRFLDAIEAKPDSVPARIYASSACFECGDAVRAASLIPPPETWHALDADLRRDLAMALIHVGRTEEAEQVLDPDAFGVADPITIAHLAMLHERTNRLDDARALLSRIQHHVDSGDHDLKLHALTVDAALAMREKDFPRAEAATRELIKLNLSVSVEANANFTLAKIADMQGRSDEAMLLLARAHEFQLQLAAEIAPEIAQSDDEPLQIATKWMSPEQCRFVDEASGPAADVSPIFIVGFPRSGTTMLEQMLDAHPGYVSMDEQLVLHHCIKGMQAAGLNYPFQLDQMDDRMLEQLRAEYWKEVARIMPVAAHQTLVDKNPLNLLRLPMIRRLFPNARIILALRHPCDVMLSCYMQNFRSPAFMILCSSLERLAKSYVNSMQSWIHHQELLQANVLLLRYEDTVADFNHQVTRIADFLGIEDSHHLAQFAEHATRKGYISTPSYSQVVEPVNSRAVARWHAYRKYFEPVFPVLQPVADHWGYPLAPT